VGFGDLLLRTQIAPGDAEGKEDKLVEAEVCNTKVEKEEMPDALMVLTPACDLVRGGGASRVLLMAGNIFQLESRSWNYKESPSPKTPILEIDDKHRVWIKWNVKDLRMLTPNEIADLLKVGGTYRVAARMRESNALEIQQKVLSSMGRIGLLAPMPATFEVTVRAYYQGSDGMAHDYEAPVLAKEGGVCFVGRDKDGKENTRLILTEQAIDDLMAAIGRLDSAAVVTAAQRNLEALKASKTFEIDIQRGLQVPPGPAYKAISCLREIAGDDKTADVVGTITRNPPQGSTPTASHTCLVIVLTDKDTPTVVRANA
jgi:hypothetical protein